ncbi:hypothetical protein VPH35_097620 [Triticum aestivum]
MLASLVSCASARGQYSSTQRYKVGCLHPAQTGTQQSNRLSAGPNCGEKLRALPNEWNRQVKFEASSRSYFVEFEKLREVQSRPSIARFHGESVPLLCVLMFEPNQRFVRTYIVSCIGCQLSKS